MLLIPLSEGDGGFADANARFTELSHMDPDLLGHVLVHEGRRCADQRRILHSRAAAVLIGLGL